MFQYLIVPYISHSSLHQFVYIIFILLIAAAAAACGCGVLLLHGHGERIGLVGRLPSKVLLHVGSNAHRTQNVHEQVGTVLVVGTGEATVREARHETERLKWQLANNDAVKGARQVGEGEEHDDTAGNHALEGHHRNLGLALLDRLLQLFHLFQALFRLFLLFLFHCVSE